jgi:putative transposase
MAGADRMTIQEVVKTMLLDEHADVIREAVKAVATEMMELEVSELIGAGRGERRPDDRATHRNGYRSRRWDTRAGEINLEIPKLRQGSYFPSFLEPRRRSEQALLAVVQQAYVCGVSTRRVDQLVESLGLRISRSEVSRVCAALDEHVEAFRTRPLEGRYPYLFLDAKVRHEALLDRAGCETPPPGRRSGPVKLRAACPWSCGERVEAALTTTRRAGTVGPCGRG